MFNLFTILSLVLLASSLVTAYPATCNFTGRVHLNASDLPYYTQDQIGCGLQRMSDGWPILLISGVVMLIALLLYGLYRRNK